MVWSGVIRRGELRNRCSTTELHRHGVRRKVCRVARHQVKQVSWPTASGFLQLERPQGFFRCLVRVVAAGPCNFWRPATRLALSPLDQILRNDRKVRKSDLGQYQIGHNSDCGASCASVSIRNASGANPPPAVLNSETLPSASLASQSNSRPRISLADLARITFAVGAHLDGLAVKSASLDTK